MGSYIMAFVAGVSILFTAQASSRMKVPRIKTASVFNHPVIAQTAPEMYEKKGSTNILRRFYIARWGVHRFEYGYALFHCRNQVCELAGNTIPVRFYESCKGFKRNGQPNCQRIVSERVDFTSAEREVIDKDRTWYAQDDLNSNNDRSGSRLDNYPDYTGGDNNRHGDDSSISPWVN